ncbi:MAG: hypothetical protein L0H83_10450 [Salinisphaera sp.]|nr:hypothetical protein [Salinisphaera sp.]
MDSVPVAAVGIAWYRREHYSRLKRLFTDGHKLPSRYDKWLKLAQRTVTELEASGKIVVKAFIDPDEFPQWCRARSLNVDAEARTRYANSVAAQTYRNRH